MGKPRSRNVRALAAAVGTVEALCILTRRALGYSRPLHVRVPKAGKSLLLRPLESDLFVLGQIFGEDEYALPPKVRQGMLQLAKRWLAEGATPVVVDGGANVGYSCLYFARLFPDALILAVEPEPETMACLVENCRQEARIRPVHAALWSHDEGVGLTKSSYGSWAHRTTGEPGLTPSIRLETLLASIPRARLLLLKLDVEGGEREICQGSSAAVASAPCIIVEPHDFMLPGHGSLSALFAALAGKRVDTLISGENLLVYDVALLEEELVH